MTSTAITPVRSPATPPFPLEEYRARLRRVRLSASNAGLGLLVVTDPKNIFYLTGYDAYTFYLPQALVVPVGQDEPVLVVRESDAAAASWLTWLPAEDIVGYAEQYVHGPTHPMAAVAELIRLRGWMHTDIGVEFNSAALSIRGLRTLREGLPEARFLGSDGIIEWVRCIKSDREVQVMREAARISDHAMRTALDLINPGAREADVAAQIYAALIMGCEPVYGSAPWQPYLSCGAKTNNAHMRWSDSLIEAGQPVMVELGGHRHNYAAGLSRTVFLGTPPARYQALHEAVTDGLHAVLDVLRPGFTAERVEERWKETLGRHGFVKRARIGYSIGISFPNTTWIENTISLAPGDRTVLRPNMTLHLMLAVWQDEFGYSLSETFRIGDSEPERMSVLPQTLLVKP